MGPHTSTPGLEMKRGSWLRYRIRSHDGDKKPKPIPIVNNSAKCFNAPLFENRSKFRMHLWSYLRAFWWLGLRKTFFYSPLQFAQLIYNTITQSLDVQQNARNRIDSYYLVFLFRSFSTCRRYCESCWHILCMCVFTSADQSTLEGYSEVIVICRNIKHIQYKNCKWSWWQNTIIHILDDRLQLVTKMMQSLWLLLKVCIVTFKSPRIHNGCCTGGWSDKPTFFYHGCFYFLGRTRYRWFDCRVTSSPFSVSASPSMWARPAFRSAMPAGSCTVWSTAFSRTARCRPTRLLAVATTASTPSSARLVRESTSRVRCSSTWSPPLLVSDILFYARIMKTNHFCWNMLRTDVILHKPRIASSVWSHVVGNFILVVLV